MDEQILGLEWSQEQIATAFRINGRECGSHINFNAEGIHAKYTFSGNWSDIQRLHIEVNNEQVVFVIDGIRGGGYVAQFNNKKLHTHHGNYELMVVLVLAIEFLGWVVPIQDWGQHLVAYHEQMEFTLELQTQLTSLRQTHDEQTK